MKKWADNNWIKSVDQLAIGDSIDVMFSDGALSAKIIEKKEISL